MAIINLLDTTFGKIKVFQFSRLIKGKAAWWGRCVCGKEKEFRSINLRSGRTTSCGCSINRRKTHGLTRTKVYRTWVNMKQRCFNPSEKDRPYYQNVKLSKRWLKFENFLMDMGQPPSHNHSIDRIRNDKGYSKSNCRWATPKEQVDNRGIP